MIESPIATTTGRVDEEVGLLFAAVAAGEHPASISIAPASRIAEARPRMLFTNAKSTPESYENAARVTIGLTHD